MKRWRFMLAALLALLTLPPLAPVADSATAQLVLLHDTGTPNQVFAFRLQSDGGLTPVSGSPFATGNIGRFCDGYCESAAYSSGKKLLFTAGGNGISVQRVALDGSLSLVPGSPFGATSVLGVAAVDRGGKTFVYASDFDHDRVLGFQVQSDGSLVTLASSPFPAGDGPAGESTAKGLLFAANNNAGTLSAFKVQNNGSLSPAPGSPFSVTSDLIFNVNVDPSASFVYVGDGSDAHHQVFGFRVNKSNAALSPLPFSPFPSGAHSESGVATNGKSLLYSLGLATDAELNVQAFLKVSQGTLVALGLPTSAGIGFLDAGALDPKGRFLVVASFSKVRSFSVNGNTAGLTTADTETITATLVNQLLIVQR